jgi:hypothetical protein
VKNVRALAAQVLLAAEKKFVDEALEAHRGAALSRRDRALLTTLVYGATRRRRELDWLIDRCAERVHPEIRQHGSTCASPSSRSATWTRSPAMPP